MIYLIGQQAIWLVLTAMFAAFAGWVFAAQRAGAHERSVRREREHLLRDLAHLAVGEGAPLAEPAPEDTLSRIREARITELERALESARARADDAMGEAAELRRRLENEVGDPEELRRLRALAAEHETRSSREIEAVAEAVIEEGPSQDDAIALQAWRLRYFEQRVKYLEGLPRAVSPSEPYAAQTAAEAPGPPLLEWRVREAQARAAFLADALRASAQGASEIAVSAEEAAPFAADADVDALLRWRLLYLERRVAHLQSAAQAPPVAAAPTVADAGPDPDRWKWRARYLEARVRHLESRPHSAVASPPQAAADMPSELPPERALTPLSQVRRKPPVLTSARGGAPDDLTLIEGVSALQQSTLNAIGVFHFDQIAAWTPENVAWVDQYLRLRGRIEEEEWLEQADELAREGPSAARRTLEEEPA